MSLQVFTPAELAQKGIGKKAIAKILKSTENRVNFYAKQYLSLGFASPSIKAAWDLECAKWDHLKATMSQFA